MPSHIVHRVVGERICGFSSEEIDRLIDSSEQHDASRYSCSHLLAHAKQVLSRYGDKGLCYLVLHHYLDKFMNIVFGRVWHYGKIKALMDPVSVTKQVFEHLEVAVRRGFEDEISVFKALEVTVHRFGTRLEDLRHRLDGDVQENIIVHRAMKYFESLGYANDTAKKKARLLIGILKNCLADLQGLEPGDAEMLKRVAKVAEELREKIATNAKWILCTATHLDQEYVRRSLGVLADTIIQLCSKG
jgi:hypothetical protein